MTSNEAVNEPVGEQAVEFQYIPQPRPALALVNGHRVVSCENYECFIGVSPNVSDLKKFIGVHSLQTHPVLLIGERGLRQEQIASVMNQASAQWAQPFFAVDAHGLSAETLNDILNAEQATIWLTATD